MLISINSMHVRNEEARHFSFGTMLYANPPTTVLSGYERNNTFLAALAAGQGK
jgi:hypothetical protein